MNESLTVVLPVHNAQHALAARVQTLLDISGELTNRFEIVIVDDASTDHTEELACELARCYPQVLVARHHRRRGMAAAVETGVAATFGNLILLQDQDEPIQGGDIRQAWRHHVQSASANSLVRPPRDASGLIERLSHWGQALRDHAAEARPAVKLIRRADFLPVAAQESAPSRFSRADSSPPAKSGPAQPSFLRRVKNFALGE